MPPRRCTEPSGVVIRISRPNEPVVRDLVPFFARDFASLATDANGRVSKETDLDIFLHVIMPALIGALCAFTDHFTKRIRLIRFDSARGTFGRDLKLFACLIFSFCGVTPAAGLCTGWFFGV